MLGAGGAVSSADDGAKDANNDAEVAAPRKLKADHELKVFQLKKRQRDLKVKAEQEAEPLHRAQEDARRAQEDARRKLADEACEIRNTLEEED